VAGLGFQVVHFAEHLLQVGYWVRHPRSAPWLTPWAAAGRDGLAAFTDGQAGTGNELLHLLGNLVFLGGLAAAVVLGRRGHPPIRAAVWLRRAVWLQSAHVAEHVALTTTWVAFGRAEGVSTLFGVLQPGTVIASSVRVWFHLALNLAATGATGLAVAAFAAGNDRAEPVPSGPRITATTSHPRTTTPSPAERAAVGSQPTVRAIDAS
jgi:hypothetical protein